MDLSRFVFQPSVTLIAANTLVSEQLDIAVSEQGLTEIAEDESTPLNNIMLQVAETELEERHFAGHGDLIPEYGGRFCYRSWKKGRSTEDYVTNVMEMQHGSVLEHSTMTFQTIGVSRTFSHELVRHRAGTAYSQESQRYVDAKDVRFVIPPLLLHTAGESILENRAFQLFYQQCLTALDTYQEIQSEMKKDLDSLDKSDMKGRTLITKRINEAARAVLPNAAETRLLMTMNVRTYRHIALLRGAENADLEIRRWASAVIKAGSGYAPAATRDIKVVDSQFGVDILGGQYGAP